MGLFDKAKAALGGVDTHLIETGTLARGNVISVDPTGMTIGGEGNLAYGAEKVCKVVVEVIGLNGEEPYQAETMHPIPLINIPQLQEKGAAVAVRVDPADSHHIALDLTTDVPPAPIILQSDDGTKQTLTTNTAPVTAADILRDGKPCTVEVLAVIPLNQNTQDSLPATGLVLAVTRDGAAPYQAQVGVHIPDGVASKVVVGATLPAKWVPGTGEPTDVNLVTPDWTAIA